MTPSRVRWLLAVAVLLALGLIAISSWQREVPASAKATGPARTGTATAASGQPSVAGPSAWDLLAAAQQAATAPPLPKVKATMSDADWRAFDQQWCAATQPLREIVQSGPELHPMVFAAWMPSDDEAKRMADLLSQRTQLALNAKGDVASQALGLWWRAASLSSQDIGPLQALAAATRDPYVLALANQRNSQQALASMWRDLEPNNLAAIWAAQRHEKLPLEAIVARVTQATSNDNRLAESFRRLAAVGLPSTGGFVELSQQVHAVGVYAANVLSDPVVNLAQGCSKATSPTVHAACERAAERIWALGPEDALGAQLVLTMVRAHGTRSPLWDDRARSVEAMLQAEQDDAGASVRELVRASACLPSALMKSLMSDRLTQSHWTWWRTRLTNDPATVAALSDRYRASRGGKGLLPSTP